MMLKNKGKNQPENQTNRTGQLFTDGLLLWNTKYNRRQMPWKGEKDPYRIWLSEIILQQTRVDQGLKYYENFIRTFPSVQDLADAADDKIYKLWEGLGYYSRCSNLITTAKFISRELNGQFPSSYDSILQLKGVGSYTASAIASFAYNLPHAVVDGNVFRVLSRIFDDATPVDSTKGKKSFSQLAQNILPKKKAGVYNQAIMDFGAMICKPVPLCAECFFSQHCGAYQHGRQDRLPMKEKKLKIRERWFNYFVLQHGNQVLIHQRAAKDIWQHLFEFLLLETETKLTDKQLLSLLKKQYGLTAGLKITGSDSCTQRLTHQLIHFNFRRIELKSWITINGCNWVKTSELDQYAFPRSLQQFLSTQLNERSD
jgi:A/G-specific adenine glycosylase